MFLGTPVLSVGVHFPIVMCGGRRIIRAEPDLHSAETPGSKPIPGAVVSSARAGLISLLRQSRSAGWTSWVKSSPEPDVHALSGQRHRHKQVG
jgi:hypothetical protein